ncbi:hypothetical protein HGRIS_006348 [Hohenbuehelia grisea]|uniref:4-coumarate--CoA ligase n=1 Tax=Hohenbuehelia grisea TaxID=104357 RepID=A0ABR3K2E7_9AGAR
MRFATPSSLPAIPDNLSVCQFMLDHQHPSRPPRDAVSCFIDNASGRSTSFQEVYNRTYGLANGMSYRYSLAENAVGLVVSPNHVDYPIVIWAIHRLNGIFTGANPNSTKDELVYQIMKTGSSYIFSHSACLDVVRKAAQACAIPPNRIILVDAPARSGLAFLSVSDLILEGSSREINFTERSFRRGEARNKVAALCFSSGTTGKPKASYAACSSCLPLPETCFQAVAISHYALIANILQMSTHNTLEVGDLARGCHGYRPGDIILLALPLFHIAGFVCNLHFAFFSAMTLVVMPKYDLLRMLGDIVRHRITHLLLVPPQAVAFCKHPAVQNFDLSCVKFVMCGAAPLSAEINRRLFDIFPNAQVAQIYGLTETATTLSMSPMHQFRGTVGSVGTLLPGVQAKIVREDGTSVGYGEPGELLVKTPSQALGYYRDDTATRETFINGWVKTGDLVTVSPEGELFILDRLKELIKVRGFQVAPAELEGWILDHPDVSDCCVVGRPDEYSGEVPYAFVVLSAPAARRASQGASAAQRVKASITKHVSEQKANYKHIADIEFVDAIPKNPSGKLLRRVLRDRVRGQVGGPECKL